MLQLPAQEAGQQRHSRERRQPVAAPDSLCGKRIAQSACVTLCLDPRVSSHVLVLQRQSVEHSMSDIMRMLIIQKLRTRSHGDWD